MTNMNEMPETFDAPLAHEEEESAHVSAPASAQAAGDAPTPDKKERRAKAKKAPTATKAARGKKAKAVAKVARDAKVKAPKPEKKPDFDIDALEPEVRELVEASVAEVEAIGRKTTENVLDLGVVFHRMAEAIPDEAHWKVAVVRHCKVSWKFADNWKRVHVALGSRRSELVQHQVTPTVLIKLLPASEETIDAVIAAFGEGKRLKVNEVKALVDGSKEAGDAEPKPQGGMKALRILAAAKLARQQKSVTTALKAIRQAFGAALEAKKLEKGKLAKELTPIAKLAHRELTEILCDIDPRSLFGGQALRHLKVEDPNWARLFDILYTLAVAEDWPDKSNLTAWLSDEVMPLLAFAIDGADIATDKIEAAETSAVDSSKAHEDEEHSSDDVANKPPEPRTEATGSLSTTSSVASPDLRPSKLRRPQSNVIIPGLMSMAAPKRAPIAAPGTVGSSSQA